MGHAFNLTLTSIGRLALSALAAIRNVIIMQAGAWLRVPAPSPLHRLGPDAVRRGTPNRYAGRHYAQGATRLCGETLGVRGCHALLGPSTIGRYACDKAAKPRTAMRHLVEHARSACTCRISV